MNHLQPLDGVRVLVLDGEQRSSLAVVRSLGRAGAIVEVVDARNSLASASRFCRRVHRIEPDRLPELLASSLKQERFDVVIPCTDATLRRVYANESLSIRMPYPSDGRKYEALSDKAHVAALAAECGIAVPQQIEVKDARGLEEAIRQIAAWPVVVKPVRSAAVSVSTNEIVHGGVSYASNASELRVRATAIAPELWPLLLQERVVGPGIGVFLLRHRGSIVARFAHRRLREKPPTGGVSVYRASVPYPHALGAAAEKLLARLDWEGPAMIECKIDSRTGTPHIMEINGRFWGSLQLAVDAGVDFPVLSVLAVLGRPLPLVADYKVGIKSRWLLGDADHLYLRMKQRNSSTLPPDAPNLRQVVFDFFSPHRAVRHEIFRWDDPVPAVRELIDWIARR